VLAGLATGRLPVPAWDLVLAPFALAAWALVALDAHNPNGRGFGPGYVLALALAGGLVAALAASLGGRRKLQTAGAYR
jgi:hypothetical protein